MVKSCCAFNCTNRARSKRKHESKNENVYLKHEDGPLNVNSVTFHLFPKDETLKKQWIRAVRRKNFIPRPYTYLCSDHFKSNDFMKYASGLRRLRDGVVPSIFNYSLSDQIERQKELKGEAMPSEGSDVDDPECKTEDEQPIVEGEQPPVEVQLPIVYVQLEPQPATLHYNETEEEVEVTEVEEAVEMQLPVQHTHQAAQESQSATQYDDDGECSTKKEQLTVEDQQAPMEVQLPTLESQQPPVAYQLPIVHIQLAAQDPQPATQQPNTNLTHLEKLLTNKLIRSNEKLLESRRKCKCMREENRRLKKKLDSLKQVVNKMKKDSQTFQNYKELFDEMPDEL